MTAVWKPIKDFPNYEVSDDGRVRSLGEYRQCGPAYRFVPTRILKQTTNKFGYMKVRIANNGCKKSFFIHRLVAIGFIPNEDTLPEVNHRDGDKTNNAADNLEWTDRSGNILHAYRVLKSIIIKKGSNHPLTTLTEEDVAQMRNLYKTGLTQVELASRFGVTQANVSSIIRRRTWTHI